MLSVVCKNFFIVDGGTSDGACPLGTFKDLDDAITNVANKTNALNNTTNGAIKLKEDADAVVETKEDALEVAEDVLDEAIKTRHDAYLDAGVNGNAKLLARLLMAL